MAYKSWLADAKDVRAIGGDFFRWTENDALDDKRSELADARWQRNFDRPLPVPYPDRLFYGASMHDSWILTMERTRDVLRVRLNSIQARDFMAILAAELDLPRVEEPWPVDLLLHDPAYVRAARIDRTGGLRFEDPYRLGEGKGLTTAEFLYDWFWEQEGRIQWIAQLYTGDRWRAALSNEVFLMVDCARASAVDLCDVAMERAYGPAARMLYEEARANGENLEEPFNLWNEHGLMDSLPDRLAAHGLTKTDFRCPIS